MNPKYNNNDNKTEEFDVIDLDSTRFSANQRDIYSHSPDSYDFGTAQEDRKAIPVSVKRRSRPQHQQQQYQPPAQYPPQQGGYYQPPQPAPIQYQYPQPPVQQPTNKGKTKRKKGAFRRFLSLLTVIAIIAAIPGVFVFMISAFADYSKEDLGRNEYVNASTLANSPAVTNILLLGCDGSEGDSMRSDTMIIVSVDTLHGKIKLTSLLRDSWLYIPCREKEGKLNSAYVYEGAQGAVDAIEYNYKIDIDHFVMVDFDMFVQLIDSLGGVDVEVTKKEANFINRTTRHTIESGESIHLNGAEALVYCRIRKLDSDYMRTYRQRKVITALINKAKDSELTALFETVQEIFPLLKTDMNAAEITGFSYKAVFALFAYDIVQTRAPIDEHFKATTINGQWAEKVDVEATREYIYDFIYTNKIKEETE